MVDNKRPSGTVFEVQTRREHPDYGDWYIWVPAFGKGRFVSEEDEIPSAAIEMISGCGAAPTRFEIEINPPDDLAAQRYKKRAPYRPEGR